VQQNTIGAGLAKSNDQEKTTEPNNETRVAALKAEYNGIHKATINPIPEGGKQLITTFQRCDDWGVSRSQDSILSLKR